jgi:pimeloyl-ACP methyl ester carboxylesterase
MTTVTATPRTRFITSADGTAIAYDVTGTGPAVVVVEGALCQRTMGTARAVAPLLSEHYAVVAYDRRGRGESGPGSSPYAVQREVEDLVAVLAAAAPDAFVVGASSGAALALEALRAGIPARKVALYEAPFILDDTHAPAACRANWVCPWSRPRSRPRVPFPTWPMSGPPGRTHSWGPSPARAKRSRLRYRTGLPSDSA